MSVPAMDTPAFPNVWENGNGGGKGRKGQKGRDGAEKGRKGGGKAGRGKGKDAGDEESLPSERKEFLEAQLLALSRGTETSAIPRVGDLVQVMTVMGSDPQHLEGKSGKVIGVALIPSLKTSGGAVTVRFNEEVSGLDKDVLDVSVAASDLHILEAVRPLPEGSLTFPKTLTGLERKFVHSMAERLGLISQSFGKGEDRYITTFRAAEGADTTGCLPGSKLNNVSTVANIEASGVELDQESKNELLKAFTIPEGWAISADRMVICRGPLQKPRQMDHRSVVSHILRQISTLQAGSACSLRVVTVGRSERAIAVGVLGVPCVDRNPHILLASNGNQGVKDLDWKPWDKDALLLSGQLKEWPKSTDQVEAATQSG